MRVEMECVVCGGCVGVGACCVVMCACGVWWLWRVCCVGGVRGVDGVDGVDVGVLQGLGWWCGASVGWVVM